MLCTNIPERRPQLKQKNLRRKNKRIGVAVGYLLSPNIKTPCQRRYGKLQVRFISVNQISELKQQFRNSDF
jgi:hypothetical protein